MLYTVTRSYGSQGMVGPLRRVLVARPGPSFGGAHPKRWHYGRRPDLAAAVREHEAFVAVLRMSGAEVHDLDDPELESADAIYTHDPSLVTDAGAVLLQMSKPLRGDEPEAAGRFYDRQGIPILARLDGAARAEGGDLLWLDERTLAVGVGFRTNREGLRQLEEILRPLGVGAIEVPLPYHEGPEACLHLMSSISLVDRDLAVAYLPLLPVPFWRELGRRGVRIVEVPAEEFRTMGPNVLALAPRRCLMLEGNPVTRARLEAAGCEVETYAGAEISLNAEGGATCLTRPILRDRT
jgi:N-dimethylarginine dimethylaminohydrolase